MGFGASKPTLEEQLRANKREINRSIREIEREHSRLKVEEQRLIQDIRNAAQQGEMAATKVMARDLVRTRRHQQKFYLMRSQLQAVNMRLQTVKSTQSMADSMKGVATIMINMNKQINIPDLQNVMATFMRESEKMGLTEDMINDAIEDAVEGDEEEEETVIRRTLDEIGVDLSGLLTEAPPPSSTTPHVVGSVQKNYSGTYSSGSTICKSKQLETPTLVAAGYSPCHREPDYPAASVAYTTQRTSTNLSPQGDDRSVTAPISVNQGDISVPSTSQCSNTGAISFDGAIKSLEVSDSKNLADLEKSLEERLRLLKM